MEAITLFKNLRDLNLKDGNEKEWGKVYSMLLEIPDAPYTTFIKLGYFRKCKEAVQRFQDIPSEYKTFSNPIKLFISHKWEEKNHPDKSKKTLEKLLRLTRNCSDDAAVWWDYCSLPQKNSDNGEDDRSTELKDFFKFQLSLIPLVILDSQCMFLWSEEGINSGWCCIEILIAQALLQHLNKMVYERKDEFKSPPLFVNQVDNNTLVETDLVRFDHKMFQKIYCSQVAIERHKELIVWMNDQLNNGVPTPYSQVIKQVSSELISKMVSEYKLTFTHRADSEFVPKMLFKIYRRLSFEPFNSFKWTGQIDFFSTWHYVKGCLGNCVVPMFSYWF
jgi:hypothetical protein